MGDFSRLERGAVFHRGFDSRRAVEQIGVLPGETRVVSPGRVGPGNFTYRVTLAKGPALFLPFIVNPKMVRAKLQIE